MADGHGSKPHETLALLGLAGLAGAAGVTWLAGATTIRLSGHHLPAHHQLAGLAALAHRSDPTKAWGVPVGPVTLYWTVTAVYTAAALALVWLGWRVLRSARRPPQTKRHDRLAGLADRKHVLQHAGARRLSTTGPNSARAIMVTARLSGRVEVVMTGPRWSRMRGMTRWSPLPARGGPITMVESSTLDHTSAPWLRPIR